MSENPFAKYRRPAQPALRPLGGPDPFKVKTDERGERRMDVIEETNARNARAAERNAAIAADNLSFEREKFRNPGITPQIRADAIARYMEAQQLAPKIAEIERLYELGPGRTSGLFGGLDHLPTARNKDFDSAFGKLRGPVKQSEGMTGGEVNTATEAKINLGPYISTSSNYDSTIRNNIAAIKRLRQENIDQAIAVLGGVPDAGGRITPLPGKRRATPSDVESYLKKYGVK